MDLNLVHDAYIMATVHPAQVAIYDMPVAQAMSRQNTRKMLLRQMLLYARRVVQSNVFP
jgi:hypothetical protein